MYVCVSLFGVKNLQYKLNLLGGNQITYKVYHISKFISYTRIKGSISENRLVVITCLTLPNIGGYNVPP